MATATTQPTGDDKQHWTDDAMHDLAVELDLCPKCCPEGDYPDDEPIPFTLTEEGEAALRDYEQRLTERIRETGEPINRWATGVELLERAWLLAHVVPGVTYEMAERNLHEQYAELERRRISDANMGGALNDADRGW